MAAAFPLGDRLAMPPESVQASSGRVPTGANLDTTLFTMASSVERSTHNDPEQMLSRDAPETRPKENVELQLRGG